MSINLAFMASGRGSNLGAILETIKTGALDAKAVIVITNDVKAKAIEVARSYGVEAKAFDQNDISRDKHEKLILDELAQHKIDFVVLAGYMRILSPTFLRAFRDDRGFYRVVNIHPSLLPSFAGKQAYEDAFAYGVKLSGITVHLVDELVDHGPILAQEAFPRFDSDTLETFKARGLAVEHKLYPQVLQMLSTGNVKISSQRQKELTEI
jgi:phosphoribosylglycinamide formyltransferase-1